MSVQKSDPAIVDIGPVGGFHRLGTRPLAFHLRTFAHEPVHPRWNRAKLLDGEWRFYIVDRPGVWLDYAGGRLAYAVDAITVIPAWLPFTFGFDRPATHAFLHLELPTLGKPITTTLWTTPWHWRDPTVFERFRTLARNLAMGTRPSSQLATEALALAALGTVELLEKLDADGLRRALPIHGDHLAPALGRIEEDLAGNLTIPLLAALVDLAPETFIRRFRQAYGQTPVQFILDRRCMRAAQLLLNTTLDLEAIAQACGFGSRHYLSRMFRRRHGTTPGEFRRLQSRLE